METYRRVPTALLPESRRGAIVTVKGEDGREYRGRIVRTEGEEAEVRVFEEIPLGSESPLDIVLVQAIPKKERMEMIIQKATELGVKEILPCRSEKSMVQGEPDSQAQDKSHRWPAIAKRAVEQCRRRVVPRTGPSRCLEDVLGELACRQATKLVLYEKEQTMRLKDLLAGPRKEGPATVVIACGPEGGFTRAEIATARSRGFIPVSLGGRVLRCETAALAAIAILQHVWGDL